MALPGDSIVVTPVSGATVATHAVSSKEYQTVMMAGDDGHIEKSKNTYIYLIPSRVFAASSTEFDIWNGTTTKLLRILSCRLIVDFVTAVTGTTMTLTLYRTTAIGTGGSVITSWLPDTSQGSIDASITMRSRPTGGATSGVSIVEELLWTEEADARCQLASYAASMGDWDVISEAVAKDGTGILVGTGTGVKLTMSGSTAGYAGFLITVSEEAI